MTDWLKTPAGGYVLQWEQAHLDAAVADLFGFHALQLGLPELDALRANRMPHRWLATSSTHPDPSPATGSTGSAPAQGALSGDIASSHTASSHIGSSATAAPRLATALHCDLDALPFESNSLDLVVLPHALELARDPHLTLREVERVLMPEGRVVIVGFNPTSLWGMRQRSGRWRNRLGNSVSSTSSTSGRLFLPSAGEFMGYRRLRDWLRLLSFEVEAGRFGCYRPPAGSSEWLSRFEWMEHAGERWWPVFGAVYFVVAVKRVRGMRLIGLARPPRALAAVAPAPVVAAHHHHDSERKIE